MSKAKDCVSQGYVQVSRKYRIVARLPTGRTGMQALEAVDSSLAKQIRDNAERSAKEMFLRMYALDKLILSREEFAEFLQLVGKRS